MENYRQFFYEFMMTYRLFLNETNALLAQYDLHRAQWAIMDILEYSQSATLVEISKHQRVEKPTVTRTINRLEEMKFVEHIPGKDKREKRMQLTAKGKKVFAEVRSKLDQMEVKYLEGLSEEDVLSGLRILGEIRENLNKGKDV